MKSIWDDIRNRENLDVYTTIGLAIVISILGAFGITSIEVVASTVLGVLGLISVSLLQNRRENERVLRSLSKLEAEISAVQYLKNRTDYPPLQETLANARMVCLMGPTLVNLFSSWSGYFREQQMVKHGTKFRVLIIDPESEAVESMHRFFRIPSSVDLKVDLRKTLSSIHSSIKIGVEPGSIEVKLLQAHPHYSMILVNPYDDDGKIFVEFVGFQVPIHAHPHIELSRQKDGQWYDYFLAHFSRSWDGGNNHDFGSNQV